MDLVQGFAGGLMIGAAALLLRLGSGRIMGASGLLYQGIFGERSGEQHLFLLGMALAALPLLLGLLPMVAAQPIGLPLALGALLVGLGASLGGGCTSGMGVVGLARLSPRAFVFIGVAMASALIVATVMPT